MTVKMLIYVSIVCIYVVFHKQYLTPHFNVVLPDITEQERLARIDSAMGMFAHLPGSVEDFMKEKQKDIEIENRRWKEEQ
jgi:hypothetical protein